jgi:hypothetical protein
MKFAAIVSVLVLATWSFAADEEKPKKPLQDPLIGRWAGTLNLGDVEHRVIIEITRKNDRFTGTLTIPEQVDKLAFEAINFEDDGVIRLEFPNSLGSFAGKVEKDRDKFSGIWKQGPAEIPLTLKRVKAEGEK